MTISNVELNPAYAVENASLAAIHVSSEDVAATPPTNVTVEMPPTQSKKSDKSKGKSVVSSIPRTKRAWEVSEHEAPRKKCSQGSFLATVAEYEEIMALVVRTLESS